MKNNVNKMFFQRAKKVGLNEWWRYLLGSVVIFLGWQFVAILIVMGLFAYITVKGGVVSTNFAQSAVDVGIAKNVVLLVLLSAFVIACCIVYLVVHYLHRKPFLSILTARSSFSWKRASFGFFCWLALNLLMFYIDFQQDSEAYTFSFDVMRFIPLLLICCAILPFQTSFEELFFRGYGMQGLGLLTGSRFWALLIPAVLFGVLHAANPEVLEYGFFKMMPFYIGMGLFLGVMAIMDEGLELPLGVHFANNFTAAVFLNMEGSALPTDALFMVKSYDPTIAIPYSLAMMLVFVLIVAFVFKWKDWGRLFTKIK